jgi:parvulin-like peptidyl-prolyl isomerase
MMIKSLLFLGLILSAPIAVAQENSFLDQSVCTVKERNYSAREVINAIGVYNDGLKKPLLEQADYRKVYFSSTRFLFQVRAFADLKRLDALGVPEVSQKLLEFEAAKWAKDRSRSLTPQAVLKSHGLEIELRARLLARQASSFSLSELRQHMLRSVPEFFGVMQCAWIRIPLLNSVENRALTPKEMQEKYSELDELAQKLTKEEITWEDAVKKYSKDPSTIKTAGAIGLVRREMTSRFEEPMLRPLFKDLGYKQPNGTFLRGPIIGERWIYLVRVEAVRVQGVVELTRVKDRVERSLREYTLQEQIAGIRKVVAGQVLAPPKSDD